MTAKEVCETLARWRFDLSSELATQKSIHEALIQSAIRHDREVVIGPRERVDFLCDSGIAIEVKLDGQAKKIYKQLERYSQSYQVRSLILATARAVQMPKEINGKPCVVLSLSRSWL